MMMTHFREKAVRRRDQRDQMLAQKVANFSKRCLKLAEAVFTSKLNLFQINSKIAQYLFFKIYSFPKNSKIAQYVYYFVRKISQSGHTGSGQPLFAIQVRLNLRQRQEELSTQSFLSNKKKCRMRYLNGTLIDLQTKAWNFVEKRKKLTIQKIKLTSLDHVTSQDRSIPHCGKFSWIWHFLPTTSTTVFVGQTIVSIPPLTQSQIEQWVVYFLVHYSMFCAV